MSNQDDIWETLERDAPKLKVPFAVVQAGSDADWERVRGSPDLTQHPTHIHDKVRQLFRDAGFSEIMRPAFYYLSRVPFPITESPDDVPSWKEMIKEAGQAAGCKVWRQPIIDGLPDPATAGYRLVTAWTGAALHDMRALRGGADSLLPTFPTATLPNCSPKNDVACRLVIFSVNPEAVWNRLSKLKKETDFCPDFLVRSNPPLGETVAGMSYVMRLDDSRCIETKVDDYGVGYTKRECELVETPGFEWSAIAHGPHLGSAILNAFDLDRQIQSTGHRQWPVPGPEHPKDWMIRDLSADVPPYPGESGVYPHGAERMVQDRWVFWTWQCGRWTWSEIDGAAIKGKVQLRCKADSGKSSDRTRSYRERAKAYAAWIKQELRSGRP